MKIRELNPACRLTCGASVYDEFKALLTNAVKIVDETGNEMPAQVARFVKNALIENGAVGYDKLTDKWAYVYGNKGLNDYGNPTDLTFVIYSTNTRKSQYTRTAAYEPTEDGAYIITATESDYSISQVMQECAELIGKCREYKLQNLTAIATPFIVICKNEDLRLSVEHILQQKEDGQSNIVVSDELGEALKGLELNTPIVFDKIDEFEQKVYDRMLNKLGTMSANINKRERVQVGEVNATVGQCEDYLYTMIDWFNKQMQTYGLPWHMETNNSLEELYTDNAGEEPINEETGGDNNV